MKIMLFTSGPNSARLPMASGEDAVAQQAAGIRRDVAFEKTRLHDLSEAAYRREPASSQHCERVATFDAVAFNGEALLARYPWMPHIREDGSVHNMADNAAVARVAALFAEWAALY